MKLLFLTPAELEEAMEEILEKEEKSLIYCKTDFSETNQTDVMAVTKGSIVEEIPIIQLFDKLNNHFHVSIKEYDVYEVGDFGDGFAFLLN